MNSKSSLMRVQTILGTVGFVFLAGCGSGTSQSLNNQPPPPTPTISTITPNNAVAGSGAFTLTINGRNFATSSTISFGGASPATTYVSATQLTAAIPLAAIVSAGNVPVAVTNNAPGGGTSNAVDFTITSGTNPVPAITTISPNSAVPGGPAFTLIITGTNFMPASVVNFGGTAPTTTFGSSTQLTAAIPAAAIASGGTVPVTVTNPAPGGGTSNAVDFSINQGANPGVTPTSVTVAPDPSGKFGKFAYVTNFDSNSVSMYNIDPASGALERIGTVAAGVGPNSVAVDPMGKFAYVSNNFSHDISMYAINATTGILTTIGTIPVGGRATSVTVHPSGKFAYVGVGYTPQNGTLDGVSIYTINASTGALAPAGTIATGPKATSLNVHIAIGPSEKLAYVVGDGCAFDTYPGYVSVYAISSTTGALTPLGPPLSAGYCSSSVTLDPFGKFAYVADQGGPDVAMYTVNASSGVLTPIGSIAAGIGPSSVAVHPTGKFAYVTDWYYGAFGHDVLTYSINSTTGVLTPMESIAAGTGPRSVAVDPSGKFAYVANQGSNNVSMYSIDPASGALTLIGTIGS